MKEERLKRSLGLPTALAIGIGTMIGAGIFVFPGIAIRQAGYQAYISFLVAGVVALFVALCTCELATAMPSSGGGYFFVSKIFSSFFGFIIGVAQSLGLVFATSFYIVGFIEYMNKLFSKLNLDHFISGWALLIITGLILTFINVFGAKWISRTQNTVVTALLTIIIFVLLAGIYDLSASSSVQVINYSNNYSSIFTTAALVFTAFIGFVQIATIGGEIYSPESNLPKSIIGSVIIVTFIYILMIFMVTRVYGVNISEQESEVLMVNVAFELLGTFGAVIVLFAGLLATLSSANSSILSASRTVYAMSKDNFVPKIFRKVNEKYKTPHNSVTFVAILAVLLTFYGKIEVLAEVASLLHLIIYAMICACVIKLRIEKPDWYTPKFKVPLSPFIPLISFILCITLIFLMKTISLLVGVGVILVASVFFIFLPFKNRSEFKNQKANP